MNETLGLELAKLRVRRYRDESESLMTRVRAAEECRQCEDFLKMGIDAYHWIASAEETIRAGASEGLVEITPEIDSAFAAVYRMWVIPCEFAEKWVAIQEARNFSVDNLEQFRECCEAAADWLERREWVELSDESRIASFAAE